MPPKSFTFDSVYDDKAPTEAIYNDICYPLVEVSIISKCIAALQSTPTKDYFIVDRCMLVFIFYIIVNPSNVNRFIDSGKVTLW